MRLAQDLPTFKPVCLILDSPDEANALWQIVNTIETTAAEGPVRDLCIKVSNWFSHNYKG